MSVRADAVNKIAYDAVASNSRVNHGISVVLLMAFWVCVAAGVRCADTNLPHGVEFDTSVESRAYHSRSVMQATARSLLECTALCEIRKLEGGKCARAVFCASQLQWPPGDRSLGSAERCEATSLVTGDSEVRLG